MTARYDYSAMTPETVAQAMDEGLDEAERLIASAVLAPDPRCYQNTVVPLLRAADAVWRADGHGVMIGSVHPNAAVRDAASAAEERSSIRLPDGFVRDTVYYSNLAPEWPAAKAALEARLAERLREAKPLAERRLARCRT